ncbi:MAG TPA: site-specific DNA-methyltransferase, partial [Ignavibacteria bacterium]|nr:site-specific DNA-methyltransferase [Ignavibacteria bacterium]
MYKIIQSDIYVALKSLQDNLFDIAVTSPPYWAQRNYGFDKQIGNEATYIEFISRLVYLFDILKDKLSDKGVFFLNIGDKYLKKYGKTPLGLIPYKLAYFMQQNDWIINDIIIWYKPNHMPTSVKNRFVNSYEPIFVLSKSKENYFTDYIKNNPDYQNIIDVNLQPTPYKHAAVYPEKLVSKLLGFTIINKDYTVLDPFAGSGTTLKVINDRNKSLFNKHSAKGIMIEFNKEYVEIIKKRTNLNGIKIKKLNSIPYDYPILKEENNFEIKERQEKVGIVNICENKSKFYAILNTIQEKDFIKNFPKKNILFLGLK